MAQDRNAHLVDCYSHGICSKQNEDTYAMIPITNPPRTGARVVMPRNHGEGCKYSNLGREGVQE